MPQKLKSKPWFKIDDAGAALKESGPKHKYPRHQHLRHELIAVQKGVYRCLLNGKLVEAGPSELLAICPGDWHEDEFAPPMRYVAMAFSLRREGAPPESCFRLLRPGLAPEEMKLRFDPDSFVPLLERIEAELSKPDAFSARALETLFSEALIALLRTAPQERLSEETLEIVKDEPEGSLSSRLEKVFERRAGGRSSVAEIAKELGMSESSLSHRCRAELGMSPAIAFARHRMAKAKELLARTQMNVKEVSDFLGFANPYHFSRVFKRIFRQSPGSVKRN